jgi:hypothetical protein
LFDAPLKDFVYVAGSFNNWQPTNAYAMKKILQLEIWFKVMGCSGIVVICNTG